MDLDYLLSRHQVSVVRADSAASAEARIAHAGLAKSYAERIAVLQVDPTATPMTGAR